MARKHCRTANKSADTRARLRKRGHALMCKQWLDRRRSEWRTTFAAAPKTKAVRERRERTRALLPFLDEVPADLVDSRHWYSLFVADRHDWCSLVVVLVLKWAPARRHFMELREQALQQGCALDAAKVTAMVGVVKRAWDKKREELEGSTYTAYCHTQSFGPKGGGVEGIINTVMADTPETRKLGRLIRGLHEYAPPSHCRELIEQCQLIFESTRGYKEDWIARSLLYAAGVEYYAPTARGEVLCGPRNGVFNFDFEMVMLKSKLPLVLAAGYFECVGKAVLRMMSVARLVDEKDALLAHRRQMRRDSWDINVPADVLVKWYTSKKKHTRPAKFY
mmetsp:Transcript_26683/g.80013  ORF Transcript_26683/g.80013 Transcript_26683/m.80013 type:complete len:335 (+) Transcript_26683:47-1051(+)